MRAGARTDAQGIWRDSTCCFPNECSYFRAGVPSELLDMSLWRIHLLIVSRALQHTKRVTCPPRGGVADIVVFVAESAMQRA
jgi:hypothetical protein